MEFCTCFFSAIVWPISKILSLELRRLLVRSGLPTKSFNKRCFSINASIGYVLFVNHFNPFCVEMNFDLLNFASRGSWTCFDRRGCGDSPSTLGKDAGRSKGQRGLTRIQLAEKQENEKDWPFCQGQGTIATLCPHNPAS